MQPSCKITVQTDTIYFGLMKQCNSAFVFCFRIMKDTKKPKIINRIKAVEKSVSF